MRDILNFVVHHSLLDPAWTGLCLGFVEMGFDGQLYRTDLGQWFVDGMA